MAVLAHKKIKLSLISLALFSYCGFTLADEQVESLDTITVTSQQDEMSVKDKKVGETIKTSNLLKRQQVQDSRDLVRYETGVTVVEAGRFGSSGYAIRGVDENRVAITVDGLHQAETLSSQGFKELFEGYGNFNNTRNSVEIETLKVAKIAKGADSVKVGTGSLGGAVLFETKDARDFLIEKDWHLGYKTGYSTVDNQALNAVTVAGRYKQFDMLFMHTDRHGHELENYDYKYAEDIQGKEREKTDPYTITKESTLVKFSFSPTDNHRFTVSSDLYQTNTRGHDRSYSLQPASKYITYDEKESRHANDEVKRKNLSFTYENFTETPFWDTLKLTYSQQKITTRARTEDYCDGNEKCDSYKNPLGLQLKDGKIVDRNGEAITLQKYENSQQVIDGKTGKPFIVEKGTNNSAFLGKQLDPSRLWLDCSIFDCDALITAYKYRYSSDEPKKAEIKLNTFMDVNGKRFGTYKDAKNERYHLILPNSVGYRPFDYKKRDLNTNTKQVNLDLTKNLSLFDISNDISYGGTYSKIRKEMINRSGYDGSHPTWWAERTLGQNFSGALRDCKTDSSFNGLLCPRHEPVTSFLIPVDSTTKSLYLSDNIQLHDMLNLDIGYRFDDIKYQPEYIPGVTPKIADDMVKGLFIPLPEGEKVITPGGQVYTKALTPEQIRKNAEENIAYIAQDKKFKKHSYSLGATFDPLDFLRLQVKYSKGFRAPTSDELYFTFKHPDFTILPNPDMKSEEAKNQEIALTLHHDWGFISTSVFQTKYRNFIDLAYLGPRNLSNSVGGQAQARDFQLYQNVNVDNAKVKGIEINSRLNLGYFVGLLDGFNMSYKFTYQKGRLDGDRPMNAIQPKTSVVGLGYDQKEHKFGADLYVTHVSAKKAKDTYNMFYQEQGYKDSAIKWRSDDYTLVDFVTYIKPVKNVTLQFGVYNLTDRKYLTWESARSIKPFGTSNLINQTTGKGINRFYSPGRNYKLSAEITF
ncbi:TonB-dependent hemoglobin/transferrin/lactoferrin family receptor [Pasteurella sp. P03HT]